MVVVEAKVVAGAVAEVLASLEVVAEVEVVV